VNSINTEDKIVALSTPPGVGAIAVIRLSGNGCIEMVSTVFRSIRKDFLLAEAESHTVHFGNLVIGKENIDEVLVTVMRTPKTYTGQDVVEISCHGSTYIQQRVLEVMLSKGARLAGPGEFTMRAFLNGRMDLSQAEAVADLIASDSATSHRLALKQMRGGFSNEIKMLRQKLVDFASLMELELDFAEEDVEFANREDLKKTIRQLNDLIRNLYKSFELGNVIRKGIPIVIAGRPNAGKSTLLNAMLNEDRAIVSEMEGTTRDTIEEEISLGGIKFRFIDTAGLRESSDLIEMTGVSKSYEKMNESPVVLYVFDVLMTLGSELKEELNQLRKSLNENVKIIPVGNKSDMVTEYTLKNEFKSTNEIFFISAKEKRGIDKLSSYLISLYTHGSIDSNNSIITSARHAQLLGKTSEDLDRVYEGLQKNLSNDLIASDLRQALMHLGEITGQISTDDLLENIFSKFCIGK
jgi:tRNA modification GTPase